jgi:tetratricopeptide (TPR) repeat protein
MSVGGVLYFQISDTLRGRKNCLPFRFGLKRSDEESSMSKVKKRHKQDLGGKLETRQRKQSPIFCYLLGIALIVGVALVAYSNSFYVSLRFDDIPNIIHNPSVQIKVLTWDHLEQLFRNTYETTIRVFAYFTLALNYYFGEFNVFGYHVVNFIIHVTSGILLYWFLLLTFNLPHLKEKYGGISYRVALFGSLIFISHPIQTQSVTYIVQRMSSMAGMFYLLSMVLYVKGRLVLGKARYVYLGGAVFSWLLGVFSKENAAVLPMFILLYEFYFFQNLSVNRKGEKFLFYLISSVIFIVLMGLMIWGKRYFDVIVEGYKIRDFTLSERVLTQFRVVLYYLTLLVYPHPSRLNLDYNFPISKTIFDPPTTIVSMIIIAGLIGYSLWVAKRRPVVSFFILWYFGNLVIESSIFPLEMVYEHRLYLPAAGPFVLFSLFVMKGVDYIKGKMDTMGKKSHVLEIVICFLIIILLTIGTYSRNRLWNNDIEFWIDCVKKSPNKARPYVNVGYTYLNEGAYDKAIDWTQKAIELDPNYAVPYYNLCVIYQKMGNLGQAITMGKRSLELDPDIYQAYYTLGQLYLKNGECEKAQEHFKIYLKIHPYSPDVHNYLGIAYLCREEHDKAIKAFEEEIGINPFHTLAHLNLGNLYWYKFQDKKKAMYHLKMGLMFLDPLFPDREEILKLVRLLERSR